MTTNIHSEAFKQAEKELKEDKVKEIKGLMKNILQEMQKQKEAKAEAEDRLRILKMEMEDLKEGRIDKIRERHDKSKKVEQVSPIKVPQLIDHIKQYNTLTFGATNAVNLLNHTTDVVWMKDQNPFDGVYNIICSNGSNKEIYL